MSGSMVEQLEAAIPHLAGRDLAFAQDLLRDAKSFRGLTARQAPWVEVLARRAAAGGRDAPVAQVAGKGIDGVRALFARAKAAGLKRPGISVSCEGVEMRLTRAPDSGRNPGAIYVKVGGEYAGKVLESGGFIPGAGCPAGVAPALEAFGSDPAAVAASWGRTTGRCSFCSLPLADERSTAVGFGKKCADNYGLAWGKGVAPVLRLELAA